MLTTLAWLACTAGTPTGETGTSDGGPTNLDSDTALARDTAYPDSGPTTDADSGLARGSITGRVVATDGSPLEGLRVTLCRGTCEYDDTASDGGFHIPLVPPDTYPMSIVELSGERGLAIPLLLVDVVDGEDIVLPSDVVVPVLEPPVPMPEQVGEVEVLEGLFLTVDPEELWLAPWAPEQHLQGATSSLSLPLTPFEEPLGTWYLAPFKSMSYADMGLRIENRWGLAPGEAARAWVCSYDLAEWSDGGVLTVSEDGAWLIGGAIRELTTLVLTRE